MITFLIGVFVLWLVWRCLTRSLYVEIAPPPPSMPDGLSRKDDA